MATKKKASKKVTCQESKENEKSWRNSNFGRKTSFSERQIARQRQAVAKVFAHN